MFSLRLTTGKVPLWVTPTGVASGVPSLALPEPALLTTHLFGNRAMFSQIFPWKESGEVAWQVHAGTRLPGRRSRRRQRPVGTPPMGMLRRLCRPTDDDHGRVKVVVRQQRHDWVPHRTVEPALEGETIAA